MSVDATVWAWKQQGVKASDKLVLLSLADRANDKHECWPSYDRLEQDTCLHRRTISECLKRLIDGGLIERKRRFSNSNVYRLIGVNSLHDLSSSAKKCTSAKTATTSSAKTATTSSAKTATLTYQRTYQGTYKDIPASCDDGSVLFNRFWDAYPKKKDKKNASRAFAKLKPTPEFTDQLVADIEHRCRSDDQWQNLKFIPYPTTYLNGEKWHDDITPKENTYAANRASGKKRLESLNGESTFDWRDPNNKRPNSY